MNKANEAGWAAWLRVLENPNSRKATDALEEDGEGPPRSCFGHLCAISPEVERVVEPKGEEGEAAGGVTYRSTNNLKDARQVYLPQVLAKKFDITPLGEFDREYSDKEIAEVVGAHPDLFSYRRYDDLEELNAKSQLSLSQIATFIRYVRENEGFKTWDQWDGQIGYH